MLAQAVLLDIARETCQHFGAPPQDFAPKIGRQLQRKFKVKISVKQITALANGYAAIYRAAAIALTESLLPHTDEYASLSHIDDQKFMGTIKAQFPAEDPEILQEIAHWVIQYEYLR